MDYTYEALVRRVWQEGTIKSDRTGVGTISISGGQIRYDLAKGFPLITTKRVFLRGALEELLWFLRGSTNAHELRDKNVNIWNEWADPITGELGPVYGYQWRNWAGKDGEGFHDQILDVMDLLRSDPMSRRIIVSAWNVADLRKMALPPCHMMFQLIVRDGKLDCIVTQRSADMFLGVPFDIASYAMLTTMFAQQAGLGLGELVWNGGDCHLYLNHLKQAKELLTREPRPFPQLELNRATSIVDYQVEDFKVTGYDPHPTIKAPVAV